MSSLLDKKQNQYENNNNKYGFIIVTIFLIWLFWPNNHSFIRLSYWADNIVYSILKLTNTNKTPEYIHYRNGAIYLAKIYPKKSEPAINAINKAIALVPEDIANEKRTVLYKEAALIKLYYGDKKSALNDLMSVDYLEDSERLRIAVLLADVSRYNDALAECNQIISRNNYVLSGYVCMAYVYEKRGDYNAASRVYDFLIEEKPNSDLVYLERASFRKRTNDVKGAKEDFDRVKNYSMDSADNYTSIIDRSVSVKELPLSLI